MKTVVIIQSNYIPWKGYFDMISKADVLVIYDEVQYTKNDWRNRNLIKTANGKQWLTIPVRQNNLEQKIFETKVLNQQWVKKHINALQINYSKAAYFNECKEWYFSLYENLSEYLSEINVKLIRELCNNFAIKTEIIDSRNLNLIGDKNERLVDACKKLNATHYLSGPAAKTYINETLFHASSIQVEWMQYGSYKEYPQLYPPFVHDVSVVDMLFNTGKFTI